MSNDDPFTLDLFNTTTLSSGLGLGVTAFGSDEAGDARVPGGRAIADEFKKFQVDLPDILKLRRLEPRELTFKDFHMLAANWILAESGASRL